MEVVFQGFIQSSPIEFRGSELGDAVEKHVFFGDIDGMSGIQDNGSVS